MRGFFQSILGYFLTPGGVLLMGALDSSFVFFLPLGIDFVVIILSARNPELFWMYAALATAGSVAGAGGTFWLGRKLGERALARLMSPSTLRRVEHKLRHSGAVAVAALGAIPPPFPFTAFVLASGAWRASPWVFLSTLAAVRIVRFAVESALAARFGARLLTWMESGMFTAVVATLAGLAIVGTLVSAASIYRGVKREQNAAADPA